MKMSKTFLYFAYGSNLLAKRIHINNPSAVRCGYGKLENYQLDFVTYSTRWKGASATIVPKVGSCVYGAVWKIDLSNMPDLDKQEGVADKIYFPLDVNIQMPNGTISKCRVYQQTVTPTVFPNIEDLPPERRPSTIYLKTIRLGARESALPSDYIKFLYRIPDNGYLGEVDIRLNLSDISA